MKNNVDKELVNSHNIDNLKKKLLKQVKKMRRGRIGRLDHDNFKRAEMEHELGHETRNHPRDKPQPPSDAPSTRRQYLNVPFVQKGLVKSMGARWNPELKKWYFIIPANAPDRVIEDYSHWTV